MATQKWYLDSTKSPGLRFEIVKLDRSNMRATLRGETGVPFERDLTQETLDKYGYTITIVQVEDAGVDS